MKIHICYGKMMRFYGNKKFGYMKQLQYVILTLALVAVSCSNKKAPEDSILQESLPVDTISAPAKADTIINEKPYEEPTKASSSSHHSYHSDKELDNMRGFDPASEDDMDDNGMQRYFDANDDEAWD